jgi:hypothetical protein
MGNIQVRIFQSGINKIQIMELRTGEQELWDDVGVHEDVHGPVAHLAVQIHKEAEPSLPKRKRVYHDEEEERSKQYRTRARERASMDSKKRVLRPRVKS